MSRLGLFILLLMISLSLPAARAEAACTNPAAPEGKVMYNNDYHVVQFCNGTQWIPVGNDRSGGGSGGGCPVSQRAVSSDGALDFSGTIWGDGTYIYGGNSDLKITPYTFNGTSFTVKTPSPALSDDVFSLWGGPDSTGSGAYIYAAVSGSPTGQLAALSYNGGTDTWSAPVTIATAGETNEVWGDGTYIYTASDIAGVQAFTFNGTAFSGGTAYDTPGSADGVWGDGTYIYVADEGGGIRALTWNGTAWTSVATYATASDALSIRGDGTYLYVAEAYNGMEAFTFNGTAFTLKGSYTAGFGDRVYTKDGYIYLNAGGGTEVFKFDGTNFIIKAYRPTFEAGASGTWVDNNYQYMLDIFDGMTAYAKCN